MENYYSTLGVAESATQDEIKKAYRKLAMQYHPDRNAGNAGAEEQFKKINEAYAAIGEPDARQKYDHMRQFGGHPGGMGGDPFGGQGSPFGFNFNFSGDINDIINQFFHQNGFNQRQPRNRDFTFNLHLTLEEAFSGKETPVQFNVNGQDHSLNVRIPAGIENGSRIRYQGHGDKSIPNVPPGDLYIQVQVVDHPVFKRQGPHLTATLEVDALEAIIGCEKEFKCIDGHTIKITVPPGTQPGIQLRLKERGMPARGYGPARGDCILHIKIQIPTDLSEIDKQIIRDLITKRCH